MKESSVNPINKTNELKAGQPVEDFSTSNQEKKYSDKEKEINFLEERIKSDTNKLNTLRVELGLKPINEKKEVIEKYEATQKVIDGFHQFCLRLPEKENPNFWDRTALSVESISQLAIPLLKIWGKQEWFAEKGDTMINALKSDLIKTYMMRYFLDSIEKSKTLDDFKKDLNNEIPKKIAEFNDLVGESKAIIDVSKIDANSKLSTIDSFSQELITVFEKITGFEKNKEFVDKMWDNFVKDFVEKAQTISYPMGEEGFRWNGKKIDLNEYKAWFFEHLFNIAYQSVDFIDNVKNGRNIIYNDNYQLLHNNFDLSKSDHYDFQVNHIDKSTTYSNIVYKWAEELGIKKLKVLIGKYLIKP